MNLVVSLFGYELLAIRTDAADTSKGDCISQAAGFVPTPDYLPIRERGQDPLP